MKLVLATLILFSATAQALPFDQFLGEYKVISCSGNSSVSSFDLCRRDQLVISKVKEKITMISLKNETPVSGVDPATLMYQDVSENKFATYTSTPNSAALEYRASNPEKKMEDHSVTSIVKRADSTLLIQVSNLHRWNSAQDYEFSYEITAEKLEAAK